MVTLDILDLPKTAVDSKQYTKEGLIKVLFENVDYEVDIEKYSDKEVDYLVKNGKEDYDKLNMLTKNM